MFCFDQIEALEMESGDNTGLFQFGQMVCDLNSNAQNVVMITCMQSQFLDRIKEALSQAALDRFEGKFVMLSENSHVRSSPPIDAKNA